MKSSLRVPENTGDFKVQESWTKEGCQLPKNFVRILQQTERKLSWEKGEVCYQRLHQSQRSLPSKCLRQTGLEVEQSVQQGSQIQLYNNTPKKSCYISVAEHVQKSGYIILSMSSNSRSKIICKLNPDIQKDCHLEATWRNKCKIINGIPVIAIFNPKTFYPRQNALSGHMYQFFEASPDKFLTSCGRQCRSYDLRSLDELKNDKLVKKKIYTHAECWEKHGLTGTCGWPTLYPQALTG